MKFALGMDQSRSVGAVLPSKDNAEEFLTGVIKGQSSVGTVIPRAKTERMDIGKPQSKIFLSQLARNPIDMLSQWENMKANVHIYPLSRYLFSIP